MQIAALTSTLGLTGTAIGQDTNKTTTTGDDTRRAATKEAPSSGAIIMPGDSLSKRGEESVDRGASNDDMAVNPGESNDDMAINPGAANDDVSVDPGPPRDETSVDRDENPSVPASGFGRQPSDMGPGNIRGE
jgi:hypothetical protein